MRKILWRYSWEMVIYKPKTGLQRKFCLHFDPGHPVSGTITNSAMPYFICHAWHTFAFLCKKHICSVLDNSQPLSFTLVCFHYHSPIYLHLRSSDILSQTQGLHIIIHLKIIEPARLFLPIQSPCNLWIPWKSFLITQGSSQSLHLSWT